MIRKSEFISRVRMQVLNQLDEREFQRRRHLRFVYGAVVFALLALYFVWSKDLIQNAFQNLQENDDTPFFLCGMPLVVACLLFFVVDGPYRKFLSKNIEKSKKILYEILGVKQEELASNIEEKLDNARLFHQEVKDASIGVDDNFSFNDGDIKLSEMDIEIGSGKNSQYIFKGVVLQIKQHNTYDSPIVFAHKEWLNGRKGLQKIALRDKDKSFQIYAQNQMQAQAVYNTGLARKLLKLKQDLKVKKVEASLFGDTLYIAISNNKNMFEPVKNHFDDLMQYEKFYDDVAEFVNVCESFKL